MNKKEQEAKTIKTYDATAKQWAKNHMAVNDWEQVAKKFKKLLPSGKILEVGCGGGRDAEELLRLGYEYFGTDASEGMIEAARTEVPSATFQQCNVYDLAELGMEFDGFWACAVLLHIPKERVDEALQAINASVRQDAVGMISMKEGDVEDFEVRDKDGVHEERLFVYWQKPAFDEALNRNGLAILDYTYRPASTRTRWHIYLVQKAGAQVDN